MASVNKDDMTRVYVLEQKSIPDIAAIVGLGRSTVRYHLLKFGIKLRTRADGIRAVAHKLGAALRGTRRTFSNEWKANISAGKRAAADGTARGTRITSNGYVEFTRGPNKGRAVHVVTMEAHIGRSLLDYEVVHHKDHDKQNNEITNLELMTRSAHTKLHRESEKKNGKR